MNQSVSGDQLRGYGVFRVGFDQHGTICSMATTPVAVFRMKQEALEYMDSRPSRKSQEDWNVRTRDGWKVCAVWYSTVEMLPEEERVLAEQDPKPAIHYGHRALEHILKRVEALESRMNNFDARQEPFDGKNALGNQIHQD